MRKFCFDPHVTMDNMKEVFEQAPLSNFKDAKEWYPTAHKYAEGYAKEFGLPVAITSGLIACLSPQKNWFHNLQLTRDFLECGGCDCRHTGVQVDKAQRIYNLAYKHRFSLKNIKEILGGLKTQNFFMNIYQPENKKFATIDAHMIQLMTGDLRLRTVTEKQYLYLQAVLNMYAYKHNLIPSEMQSVLWITWKQIKPKRVLI